MDGRRLNKYKGASEDGGGGCVGTKISKKNRKKSHSTKNCRTVPKIPHSISY